MTVPSYAESILGNCPPLAAQPTEMVPKLKRLEGIRAVLFDIYGTLLISASGDIGANAGDHRLDALRSTCKLFQLELQCDAGSAIGILEAEIAGSHQRAKLWGVDHPEVDIVEIWQATLPRIATGDLQATGDLDGFDFRRFALEYEVRVNPVWPMPEVKETLANFRDRGIILGIVSNAQFFTPVLFPALLGKKLEDFGFCAQLAYFSYEHGQAKPSDYLYRLARKQLQSQGIEPAETLYVGNDMLNDIAAAASVGFRTALFAGDRRSLRLRLNDERAVGVEPDLVVTSLIQLCDCITT